MVRETTHLPKKTKESDRDRLKLVSSFSPAGDQGSAIDGLVEGLGDGLARQTLLGVTGSGKTFTMAQRHRAYPAAGADSRAQQDPGRAALWRNSRASSPNNAVEYFVSYYDYYQPEAYIPRTDTYIEKDSSINRADRPRCGSCGDASARDGAGQTCDGHRQRVLQSTAYRLGPESLLPP